MYSITKDTINVGFQRYMGGLSGGYGRKVFIKGGAYGSGCWMSTDCACRDGDSGGRGRRNERWFVRARRVTPTKPRPALSRTSTTRRRCRRPVRARRLRCCVHERRRDRVRRGRPVDRRRPRAVAGACYECVGRRTVEGLYWEDGAAERGEEAPRGPSVSRGSPPRPPELRLRSPARPPPSRATRTARSPSLRAASRSPTASRRCPSLATCGPSTSACVCSTRGTRRCADPRGPQVSVMLELSKRVGPGGATVNVCIAITPLAGNQRCVACVWASVTN